MLHDENTRTWTAEEVAVELADLFEMDSWRCKEGWEIIWYPSEPNRFNLKLDGQVFTVVAEKVRG